MILMSGDCAGQGRCWSAHSCSSNQDWTIMCVCGGDLSSKNCSVELKELLDRRIHLVTYNFHIFTGGNSTTQSNYRISRISRYCCSNHHRSTFMFHSWNETFRIIGFLGRSPYINPAWFWKQRERRLIWPYYAFPVVRRPFFMIIKPYF
jgi:hypothetical protein